MGQQTHKNKKKRGNPKSRDPGLQPHTFNQVVYETESTYTKCTTLKVTFSYILFIYFASKRKQKVAGGGGASR